MSITTSTNRPVKKTRDPDAHLLDAIHVALGKGGSINDLAVAVASLGHPTWFARYGDDSGYQLVQPINTGSPVPEPSERLFTTKSASLQHERTNANALAFRVKGLDGRTVTYAWSEPRGQVEPFRVVQRPVQHEHAKAVPTAQVTPKPPLQPVVLIDRELAAENIRALDVECAEVEQKLQECREKAASIRLQAGVDQDEIDALTDKRSDRIAAAISAGHDIGDKQPETPKIEKLRLRIAASSKALKTNAREQAAGEARLNSLKEQRSAAIIDWAGAEHSLAMADLKSALSDLAPLLIKVAAVDRGKMAMIGTARLVTNRPNHLGLTSGEKLINTLIAAIPDAVRPDELMFATLPAAIGRVAAELVRGVREE